VGFWEEDYRYCVLATVEGPRGFLSNSARNLTKIQFKFLYASKKTEAQRILKVLLLLASVVALHQNPNYWKGSAFTAANHPMRYSIIQHLTGVIERYRLQYYKSLSSIA
jgi:hypothetical protein